MVHKTLVKKGGKFTINVNPRNKTGAVFIRGFIVLSASANSSTIHFSTKM